MVCNVTDLMLYASGALAEDEVVSFANHAAQCARCRARLSDPCEFKAAVLAWARPQIADGSKAHRRLAELRSRRDQIDRQITALAMMVRPVDSCASETCALNQDVGAPSRSRHRHAGGRARGR